MGIARKLLERCLTRPSCVITTIHLEPTDLLALRRVAWRTTIPSAAISRVPGASVEGDVVFSIDSGHSLVDTGEISRDPWGTRTTVRSELQSVLQERHESITSTATASHPTTNKCPVYTISNPWKIVYYFWYFQQLKIYLTLNPIGGVYPWLRRSSNESAPRASRWGFDGCTRTDVVPLLNETEGESIGGRSGYVSPVVTVSTKHFFIGQRIPLRGR